MGLTCYGGQGIRYHYHSVIQHHRVARCRLTAHPSSNSGNQDSIHPSRSKLFIEVGRAMDEGAKPGFDGKEIRVVNIQIRMKPEALVAWR